MRVQCSPRFLVGCRLFILLLLPSCRKSGTAKPSLRILCGVSMAQPIQEIGQAFGRKHNIEVVYDMGGLETLLPRVLM